MHWFIKAMVFFVIVFMLATCSGNSSKDQAAANEKVFRTIELSIEGMTCEGCEEAIKASVGKIEGVETVEAYHSEGFALVKYDTVTVSLDQIKNAVLNAGYTPIDHPKVVDEEIK